MFKNRIEREKITVRKMIRLYCRLKHDKKELCRECRHLIDYADKRLSKCPYGNDKPACNDCPVHCYRKEEKDRIRTIMRFSGPKMILYHPFLAIIHLIDKRREQKNPGLE